MAADVALMAGNVLLQAGELENAAKLAEVASRGNADSASALTARIAIARRDLDMAARLAGELMARNPSEEHRLLLARVAHARGLYAEALRIIDGVDVYDAGALRGDALARLDRHEEAIRAYEDEIARFPSNRTAYSRLAILHYALGDRDAAEKTLARLLVADPSPAASALVTRTRAAVNGGRG
jgi:tetratricopeptide (TPR) repeat protein